MEIRHATRKHYSTEEKIRDISEDLMPRRPSMLEAGMRQIPPQYPT